MLSSRWALLVLPLLALGAFAYWFSDRPPSVPVTGKPAPEFRLNALSGQSTSLSDYRGHPVVVNFWATWCEPCKEEMPALQAEMDSHPDLVILGVDNVEPVIRVRPFVEQYGLRYPILLDQDGTVIEQYRVVGMPTSFFVDRGGILRAEYRGALTPAILQQDLAAISGR